jgi:hypothetical protein
MDDHLGSDTRRGVEPLTWTIVATATDRSIVEQLLKLVVKGC